MRLVLCPRCELNYIIGNENYCKVCLQEMRGQTSAEETELCSICNENPVVPGKDVCAVCLQEMSGGAEDPAASIDQDERVSTDSIGEMDSVAQMDDILPDVKDEEMDKEYGSMHNPMSLEDAREKEDSEEEEDDEEDQDY